MHTFLLTSYLAPLYHVNENNLKLLRLKLAEELIGHTSLGKGLDDYHATPPKLQHHA